MRYARGEGVPSQWAKRMWPVEVGRWLGVGLNMGATLLLTNWRKGIKKEASEQGSLVDG